MPVDQKLYDEIFDLLSGHLDLSRRDVLLNSAFIEHPALLNRINRAGSNSEFTAHLIRTLIEYGSINGKNALIHFLEVFKEEIGENIQTQIDVLTSRIQSQGPSALTLPPDLSSHASQDASEDQFWYQLVRRVRPTLGPQSRGCKQTFIVLSAIATTLFGVFMFLVTVIWTPGAAQRCGHEEPFGCGLYGPPTPSSSEFVIVVAGFGLQTEDGTIVQDKTADDASLMVAQSLRDLPFVDKVIGPDDPLFGTYPLRDSQATTAENHIIAASAEERAESAKRLAAALNADLVVYGVIRHENNTVLYAPEYYETALQNETSDVVQFKALNVLNEDVVIGSAQTTSMQAGDLPARLTIIYNFMQAMTRYTANSYADALPYFQAAIDQTPNEHVEDTALLYVLMANAAGRAQIEDETLEDRQTAMTQVLDYYKQALVVSSNYSRGLIGSGEALSALASLAGDFQYDESVTLPRNTNCLKYTLDDMIDSAQKLNLLALDCYEKARNLTSAGKTIDDNEEFIRAVTGSGTIYATLSMLGGNFWAEALDAFKDGVLKYESVGETFRDQSQESVGELYSRYAITQMFSPNNQNTCEEQIAVAQSFHTGFELLSNFDDYSQPAQQNCEAMQDNSCDIPAGLCSFD